jgi:hypothetical protein
LSSWSNVSRRGSCRPRNTMTSVQTHSGG